MPPSLPPIAMIAANFQSAARVNDLKQERNVLTEDLMGEVVDSAYSNGQGNTQRGNRIERRMQLVDLQTKANENILDRTQKDINDWYSRNRAT